MRRPVRRQPTILERVLGKKRARRMRRRLAYLAVGTGVAMLWPALSRVVVVSGAAVLGVVLLVR
jgi:hypothetical protein